MVSSNAAVPARENVPPFFPGLHAGARASRLAGSMAASALTGVLLAQAAIFAAAVASGKIPAAVLTLFRALLTL